MTRTHPPAVNPEVSVVLPVLNEAENLPHIIPAIHRALATLPHEIIVVDDNSPDGSARIATELAARYPVRVIIRYEAHGLSQAVLAGFAASKARVCVVMDADLSHPPELLLKMVKPILCDEADITVGSRHIMGGSISNWPWYRQVASRGAALLTTSLTPLSDPTSGFMALRRELLTTVQLEPHSWKIVLETVFRLSHSRILEVPIVFRDRLYGQSKLSFKEQWHFVRHLSRLYAEKFGISFEFLLFAAIGLLGVLADSLSLMLVYALTGWDARILAVFGFIAGVSHNYFWNRQLNFGAKTAPQPRRAFLNFLLVCTVGLGVRLLVMQAFISSELLHPQHDYLLLNLLGILAGAGVNFTGSKWLIFR